eukprot:TRINITY_DN12730_c0_g1_i1.p1 TRINITY_DN12730_c0_g1~~TRINITY_DN12730_c0_g1_i1.p1  ORF type:complete len:300 (+),score=46.22 TRINITY_DN12730_c0_g1_i1:263-1162(+)
MSKPNWEASDLTGKRAIVTGSNTGIGLETAKELARLGAEVIVACRDDAKGNAAAGIINQYCGNDRATFMRLDLADLKSVRKFVKRCSKRRLSVDYLINNAGVMVPPYTLTAQGFELQFGVNHLAHFLLTNLLLEAGLINDGGRIVNLSSSVARLFGKIIWDDLQWTKSYSPWNAYGQSKLCNVLFTMELHNRLNGLGKNITAYSVDPGAVRTDLQRHPNWLTYLFEPFRRLLFKTPLQGAQTSLYCALEPQLESEAGKFFADSAVVKKVPSTFNSDDAAKLWLISEQLVGHTFLSEASD